MALPWQALDPDSICLYTALATCFYEVPPNQREFSWKADEQIQKLWDDLTSCVRSDFQLGLEHNPLGHFVGTIVVIGPKQASNDSRHRIIDGQQRLTSVSLLCRVLLDAIDIEQLSAGDKQTLALKLLPMLYMDVAGVKQARLKLNREGAFFEKSILDHPGRISREEYWAGLDLSLSKVRGRIVEAVRHFSKLLFLELDVGGTPGSESRNQWLKNYVSALCDYFYVLKVRVEDTRMAYRLFETLNERGLDLSQADLVRNAILEAASGDPVRFENSTRSWVNMLDQFDSQEPELLKKVTELIQFSYSSRYRPVKAEGLFDEISRELRRRELQPDNLAENFALDSLLWTTFLQGNMGYWTAQAKQSHEFILHIKPIWKRHAVPLLLRVAERFDSKKKAMELGKALWAIECYLFREGTIGGASLNKLEKDLGDAAAQVAAPNLADNAFVTLLCNRSSDSGFKDNFAIATASGKLAFYIAWRLEKYSLGEGGYDMGALSPAKRSPAQHLEHIMPRKPDTSWDGIENHEQFDRFLNRLGNHLVLERAVNASIKNTGFSKKLLRQDKPELAYAGQKLSLPKHVVSTREWYPTGKWKFESIELRQRFLADNLACKTWKIEW